MVDSAFLQAPIHNHRPADPFRFISVGSLNEVKGFDTLLKAFANSFDNEAQLIIIGDGPLKDTLIKQAKELSITDRVYFKGRLSREEIVKCLSNANAFVLASRSETFGVSYIEAMAMGLPVIATRCGGPDVFMNEFCGIMVNVDDVGSLTDAMNNMIKDIKNYSPIEIRDYVSSLFSGAVIAKRLESILIEEVNKQ